MIQHLLKKYKTLCKPSQFYLFISLTSIIIMLFQNMGNSSKYCVGSYECDIKYHNIIIFISKLLYVVFWTIIFDSLCKNGYKSLAWGIILVPFIMMFIMISLTFFM